MGLIRTAIQAGAVYGIAHEGFKAYDKHEQAKYNQQQSMPQQQYQQPRTQPQQQWRDNTGYIHQPFCNGTCQHRCNGDQSNASRSLGPDASGYTHQQWCSAGCGNKCNGAQGSAFRSITADEGEQRISTPPPYSNQPSSSSRQFDEKKA